MILDLFYYHHANNNYMPTNCTKNNNKTEFTVQRDNTIVALPCSSCMSTQLGFVFPLCEPVWPSGKALGWEAQGLRFESASALLSLQKLWSRDTVLRLRPSQLMKHYNDSHRCPS